MAMPAKSMTEQIKNLPDSALPYLLSEIVRQCISRKIFRNYPVYHAVREIEKKINPRSVENEGSGRV